MSMQDSQKTSGLGNSGMTGSTGTSGSNQSSEIYDTDVKAQQKTGELIDQAQEKVGEMTDKVKEQATSQISSQKDRAAEGLGNVADAIRQTGEQLRKNDQVAPVAQYTDQLAQGVEMVSNYLQSKSLSEIVGEVERFARREPALFLGGALTIGLLAGRFLRSSSSSSMQSQNNKALARTTYDNYGTYGSRSTGYSTALSSDVGQGYSSRDMSGSFGGTGSLTESLSDPYTASSDLYSGVSTSESSLPDLNSGSSESSGYSSGFPTGGYNSNYPTDAYGSDTGQSYGSQRSTGGGGNGGPVGGA